MGNGSYIFLNPVCLLVTCHSFEGNKAESFLQFAIAFILHRCRVSCYSLLSPLLSVLDVFLPRLSQLVPSSFLRWSYPLCSCHLVSIYYVLSTLVGPGLPTIDETFFQQLYSLVGEMDSKLAFYMTTFDIYIYVCVFFFFTMEFFSLTFWFLKKNFFSSFLKKYLFIWPYRVLVSVCGVFSCGMWTLGCCKCDLVLGPEWTQAPCIGTEASQPLAHQGRLGVPYSFVLLVTCSPKTLFIWFSLWLRSSVSSSPLVSSRLPVIDSFFFPL